jgi:predicted DsbA family dithiol-disulfide isomerase
LNPAELKAAAQRAEIEERVRASTAEFHALKVTQRPAFVLENEIGDKAVLSGTWRSTPIAAALEAMLEDETAYAAWAAHVGNAPAQ